MPTILQAALAYLEAGLCVLAAVLAEKRPALRSWKEFQNRLPTRAEVERWFSHAQALCIIAGAASGNLFLLDFDNRGELYRRWAELVEEAAPGLLARLVRERSQGGGVHVIYRGEEPVGGNAKLAQRRIRTDNDQPVVIKGKTYVPRRVGDHWEVLLTLIETRGEGGLFLCAPSPGYELLQGDFTNIPVLTAEEHEILVEAARALNEALPKTMHGGGHGRGGLPGDEFNARGDVRALLRKHGWGLAKHGDTEYWRRPGKERGWSATFRTSGFYVFSTNAPPFEADRGYSPFAVYAFLEHDGDFRRAADALRRDGYGDADTGWPEPQPLPDGLPPVPEFDPNLLPWTLRDWLVDIAERMQVPLDYLAAGAMVALAAAVGRKVNIRPKRHDDWTVAANLWGMVVGKPGVLKTPAIQEVLKPLRRLEASAAAQHQAMLREHKADRLVAQAKAKEAQGRLKETVSDGTSKKGQKTMNATDKGKAEQDQLCNGGGRDGKEESA